MNWRDNLPDNLKGEASLANFEDVGQLAQSFIETKKFQGNSIRVPTEDDGEDAIKAFNDSLIEKAPNLMYKPNFDDEDQSKEFYRTLGLPESPEGYAMPSVEVPEGVVLSESKQQAFKEMAHKHGLAPKQFQNMMADIMAADIGLVQANAEQAQGNIEALKQRWGAAHGDNMKIVNMALEATKAPEDVVASVKDGTASPDTVQWLHDVGTRLGSEGNELGDEFDSTRKRQAMSPAEAKEAIDAINNNKEHPYWDNDSNPAHADAVKKMVQYQRWANPQ